MRACNAGVRTVGLDPRCRAESPATPSVSNRCFQSAIVRELQPVFVVIVA
jgi:hypothetical protein